MKFVSRNYTWMFHIFVQFLAADKIFLIEIIGCFLWMFFSNNPLPFLLLIFSNHCNPGSNFVMWIHEVPWVWRILTCLLEFYFCTQDRVHKQLWKGLLDFIKHVLFYSSFFPFLIQIVKMHFGWNGVGIQRNLIQYSVYLL